MNICGGCGCGDRKGTWLISDADEYSKLDYPSLQCPLKMPGFSNYEMSSADESVSPITRRYFIEQMKNEEVESVVVTSIDIPEKQKKAIQEAIRNKNVKSEEE